jgi:asparagine synthetase B (glutamine-hydrolysing)
MSGVLGIAHSSKRLDVCAMLDRMTTSMAHRDCFHSDHWGDAGRGIAVGRIGLGTFNASPQPYWSEDRTVALFMSGEVYEHDGLETTGGAGSSEEISLRLYQRTGLDFAQHLNGAFIIALWDQSRTSISISSLRKAIRAGCTCTASTC